MNIYKISSHPTTSIVYHNHFLSEFFALLSIKFEQKSPILLQTSQLLYAYLCVLLIISINVVPIFEGIVPTKNGSKVIGMIKRKCITYIELSLFISFLHSKSVTLQ